MSDEELGLITTAIRYGPFPPKPEHLPACHRMAERGWLTRQILAGHLTFDLSPAGITALELGVPMGDATEAMN